MRMSIPEIAYHTFLLERKSTFTLAKRFLVMEVLKERSLPLATYRSISKRVINTAVKIVVIIPIIKVVAKPLIGPLPKIKSTAPVRKVVILASSTEVIAWLNPSWIAWVSALPFLNSSRIRSKIITFASIDIPMVSTIPAIPGRVSTELILTRIPNISRILKSKAISAKTPARP